MVRIGQGAFEVKSSANRHLPATLNHPRSPLLARRPALTRWSMARDPLSRDPLSLVNELAFGWLRGGLGVASG